MDLSTRLGRREQGQRIQRAVEQAGLSVEELASRIGCSRALIYQYLSGTTLAQPDRLQQIAQVTGVPLASFYETEPPATGVSPARAPRRSDAAPPAAPTADAEIAPEEPRIRLTERLRVWEELALAQESPPDWSGLASTCERILTLASPLEDTALEARTLLRMGKARIRLGEYLRAADTLRRAVTLFQTLSDARGEVDAQQTLGHALMAAGRVTEARDQFLRVVASTRWEARWSGAVSLAAVYEQLGDYRRAMEYCDEAAMVLEEGREEGEGRQARTPAEIGRGLLYVNMNRVNLYMANGDFKSAEPLARHCLEEAESLGISDQHLEARLNLGLCALYRGYWAAAHRTFTAALQLARFLGDRGREAIARACLAMTLAEIGETDTAIQLAKDALSAALSQGDHRAELFAQRALTDAYANSGRDSEARYHANQALGVATALQQTLFEAECRCREAALVLSRWNESAFSANDPAVLRAAEELERALTTARRLGARHLEAVCVLRRAELHTMRAETEAGEKEALLALEIAADLAIRPLIGQAEYLLAYLQTRAVPLPDEVISEAEARFDRAIGLLEEARTELREAGILDTLLELPARQSPYLAYAAFYLSLGRNEEALRILDTANWPPLLDTYQMTRSSRDPETP